MTNTSNSPIISLEQLPSKITYIERTILQNQLTDLNLQLGAMIKTLNQPDREVTREQLEKILIPLSTTLDLVLNGRGHKQTVRPTAENGGLVRDTPPVLCQGQRGERGQ